MKVVIKGRTIFDGIEILKADSILIEDGIVKDIDYNLKCDNTVEFLNSFILPGMVDAHIHISGLSGTNATTAFFGIEPKTRLMRGIPWLNEILRSGFTTIRDCGNDNSIFLRDAVKEGLIRGPRIVAAGKALTQTFGHGELSHSIPVEWNEERGWSIICDGVDECIKGARSVLRSGADFIKIITTGGVISERDSPEQEQFTLEEISAIVREAEKAGTYVAAHAHGDQGIRNAIDGGVKFIEHGTLASHSSLKIMAEKNVSLTVTLSIVELITKYGRNLG
ncbi:amidohydrolase, partial [mine drainage metagenome]